MSAGHALQVLDFPQVIERLAAHCQSALGVRLAAELEPEYTLEALTGRLQETLEAAAYLNKDLLPGLGGLADVGPEVEKASKGATLDGETLWRIGQSLLTIVTLRAALERQEVAPTLAAMAQQLPNESVLADRLTRSLDGDGSVRDEASSELTRLRNQIRKNTQRLSERIQSYTSGANREYLSDPIVTQRQGRYVIPVKSEHRGKIRGLVHDTSASGQTVFIEPMEVVEMGNQLREAEAAERAEVSRILGDLSSRIGAVGIGIRDGIQLAGELDLIFAKARYGFAEDGCVPEIGPAATISIRRGRHPLLDVKIAIPLSLEIPADQTGILITGPNTGGKTVSMKTIGLFIAMAHCGMMVPASAVQVGPFTGIWADIGDEQSLEQSLSTFSGHIRNIATALREVTPGGLVILDEVGAGTDPAEGAALAKAILLAIQRAGAKVVASTHYGELKVFAGATEGFINCSMEFDVKSLRPTYQLLVGSPGSSHALRIAERVGLPKHVIQLAEQQGDATEADLNKMVEQLEIAHKRAIKAQSEADRLTHRLKQVEQEAERKIQEADEARRRAKKEAAQAVEDELRTIRLEAAEVLERVKKAAKPDAAQAARESLRALDSRGQRLAGQLRPQETRNDAVVQRGSRVKVVGYSQVGTVLEEPSNGKVRIQIGPMKMEVRLNQLELVAAETTRPKFAHKKNMQLEKLQTSTMEIDLRGERAEDAEQKLAKFIDDALLAGLPTVRILHGKGDGILRAVTRAMMATHPGITSFRDGQPEEGGAGVTFAVLD